MQPTRSPIPRQTKQSKLARSLHTNQPRKEQLGWSSMGKKRKQDQRRDESSSSDAKRHRSRHCQNGDSSDDGMPDALRDAVIELKDFIQVKVSTEEKFRRKIEKLKQKRKKDKKKQKEFRKYIKILTEDVRSLKESHEELKSKFQEILKKEGCAEVNQYDASPSQRSQLSQSIRFWLAIETEVSKTVYKKERVLTVDGGDRIKVVMYDGINQIKSDHPLASVKVRLVLVEGWLNECKPRTKEEFVNSIVEPRKGITSVVKNGTFNLVNGSCSHEGAIIMDNSQQREVKLGVMIAVHNEERVLEGLSNPFKVQESRTKNSGSKKKVQKPPSLVPTGNMVQQTGIHKTQHGQGLVSQGEQHSLPPPDIQGLQQKEDRGGHKQFPTDDTVDDNGLKSYPPVTMQLTVAPVPGNGHGNGEKSSQQIPMQFSGQSTSAHSMQHGQDHSLPPRNIQRPLQAADRGGHKQFPTDDTVEDNRLRSYPPVTMQLTGAPVQGNGHALFGNGEKSSQQIPMQFSGQSTSAHSMQHGQDHSLPPRNIQRPLQAADRGGHKQFLTADTVEDNRLRRYPLVTMQLTGAPVQGNGHDNGEKSSQQIPMQFSGQSTSAHSMQHGQDHSLSPCNIRRPLQAADRGGHKQFPTDDTVEDNRLRSYPPVTMQLTGALVQGNGHALFGNGEKSSQQIPMQFSGQSTSAHSMQHGQDHSLPPRNIQRPLQAADCGGHKQFPTADTVEDNRLRRYPLVTMQLTGAPVQGNGHDNGEKSSQQIPMQFSGQSTSAHSMQHGQDHSLSPCNIRRPLQAADRGGHKQFPTDDTVEDNRLRSYPPVTMQLTGAPVQGNGHALFGNGEKSSQQIPMQFSGQSTSAHSMQHGQDHSLPPRNIQRPLQAADRGGHKQFPIADTVEDNRLRSYPPVTMQLTGAPVQGNGHALFGNGEKSSQQIPMQISGQSTSAHSMQHGQDHSLPPRNIQRPLHAAADQFELDCGQDWDAYIGDASPELESTFSAYTSNGLQTGQWTSIPGGEISVEDAHHLNAQKQIQETSGSLTCGQVLLLWDKPDVELMQRFDFLNQIMPPFSTHRESFPSTSLIYKAHKLLASATRTPPHRRGILIQPIEPYNSDDEPTVKKQRHAKYQLRFVNRVCNDYYTREHIKSDNGKFLKVALYDENNLGVTSGPLSSASVEVVLLHGDFNAEGEDNWTSEEFSKFLVCPQSVKEPPGVGGDRVPVLIDGEADLSNINFQNSSFHARTGKFKMGVELRNVREERVQEGITSSFLVRVRQGEGGLSKNRNVGCGGYSEVYKENKNTMENKSQDRSAMTVKDFSYKQLIEITNNFSKDHIVGRGTYGVVYKGVLKTGIPIAVKKLYQNIGHDNEKQFKNDFTRLMEIKHKNIVRFLCYINDVGKERALCFEYLARGNLHKHISDAFSGCDWSTRYGIIKGICEGLNYLHSNQIYHLDLKPSNILLDDHMVPKIADFGLSRVFIDSTHSTREIVVTRPRYMPPEYVNEQIISKRCDVFSLGVIIIEIMTGSKGYCKTAEQSQQEFIVNVHENWRKRLQRTMLPRASEQVQQVQRCIKLALKCAEANWMKRPTLTEIVDELNKIDAANSSSGSSYISTLEKQDELCGQQHSKMETQGDSDSEEELPEEELVSKEELYLKPNNEVTKPAEEQNLYLRRNKVTRRKIQLFRP